MKNLAFAALTLLATTNAHAADYRDYGFKSEVEMNNYFSIVETEVVKVETTSNLFQSVHVDPSIARSMQIAPPVQNPPPQNPPPAQPAPGTQPPGGTIFVPGQQPGTLPGQVPGTLPGTIPGTLPGGLPPIGPSFPQFPGSRPGVSTGNPVIDILLNPSIVDSWVTVGLKVWALIASNRPVANVSTQRIAVVPSAQVDWSQMENWKGPAAHTYTIKRKNGYGMTVMENTYTIAYNYGGQVNGQGAFLANATVIPTNINVIFGFTLNADAQAGNPVNVASKESPVAGVEIQVRYKVSSLVNHNEGVDAFFLKGDGTMTHINQPTGVRVR